MSARQVVTARIAAEDLLALRALARSRGLRVSELVRSVVRAYLERQREVGAVGPQT